MACQPIPAPVAVSRSTYAPTREIDDLIRDAYRQYRLGSRRAIPLAAKRIGWPRWKVNRRALALGLARTKEAPWTEREIAILERCGWMSPYRIVLELQKAGFSRTATGVHLKRKRLHIRSNGEWYSVYQLADAFGVDTHKVKRWIDAGWLKSARRGTNRLPQQGGDTYLILHVDVRAFALAHPDEYDLAKVEKFWYLDLITDGKICR